LPKLQIEFDGFDEVIARLNKLGARTKPIAEQALKESHAYVTEQVQSAIAPHKQTGKTEASLQTSPKIEWSGSLGSVEVGFDIHHGGLPSIFLMYGTPRHAGANQYGKHGKSVGGTGKDSKLYNAFYGTKTRNKIKEIQEEIFYAEIRRLNG